MIHVKSEFSNFELFSEAAKNWDIDFRLLSSNDFRATLTMFATETFQISRTSLQGKIDQYGKTPEGFRSIVIPANAAITYSWLHKEVDGSNILIFPKDGTLDSVSYEGFDVFVVDVREALIDDFIHIMGMVNLPSVFNQSEQYINLSPSFFLEFNQKTSYLLNENLSKPLSVQLSNQIIHSLLSYLDKSTFVKKVPSLTKRQTAVTRAVDFIHQNISEKIFLKELCKETGMSERSLEYGFKKKYHISPNQYIKAYKLNEVKKELIAFRGSGIKISTIAGKYDFWHMGQFANDFKKHFGVLPSDVYLKNVKV